MPSPLGHALTGFAVGWLLSPSPVALGRGGEPAPAFSLSRVVRSPRAWLFAAVGMAADLDLIVGLHSRYTHSVGAVLLVLAAGLLSTVRRRPAGIALPLAIAASYGSHVLLDWLANDTSPPLGIMALWPFDNGFYLSSLHVFMGISRKYWLAAAWTQNLVSITRELLILIPFAVIVARYRPCRHVATSA